MLRPTRLALLHALQLLFAIALVLRAGQVQLWQRGTWQARAEAQQFRRVDLAAPRGDIFDERGTPLAQTRDAVRISVAPREFAHPDSVGAALVALGVPRAAVLKALDRGHAWVTLPGLYPTHRARAVTAMRGVYADAVLERVYTQRDATRRVVGNVDASGAAVDGLELALDSVLRGNDGRALGERSARGGASAGAHDTTLAPRTGDVVVLTINQELQEIAQRALDSAVAKSGSTGGDLVVLDPEDGEIRAMASRRLDPRSAGSPVLSEPFEPGSTLKPLVAATLLGLGRARPEDRVNTEHGKWVTTGRTITDEHPAAVLTLRDVIRLSSNIGIAKFSARLSPHEEFSALRDFGFGMPTGVPFPSEAAGTLRAPATWTAQSPASLAMGYEIAVTPLQLAAAYVPLANGGDLLEPALVKEIRSSDGTVRYRHARRVVRHVVDTAVAATVRGMMVDVVTSGTSTLAAMRNFTVAGKTGTSRRATVGGHKGYAAGHYTASFVALFPANHPQYVMLVKLDDPKGEYFGGKAAAPVTKIVLEAALASRDASLDRTALVKAESLAPVVPAVADAPETAAVAALAPGDVRVDSVPAVFALPDHGRAAGAARSARTVPVVRGLPVRAAVLALHRAGFHVTVANVVGSASGTVPAAGTLAPGGALVRVESAP